MIRLTSVICLAIAMIAIVGCSSIQVAPKESMNDQKLAAGSEQNVAHVNAQTWGLYVLSIPILTGDTENEGTMAVMKDTVNVKSVVNMATKKSKELGATKSLDMVSSASSIWIFPLFVVFLRSTEVSTNAVK